MIGGVGQRMLTGVSKRMADEFFGNVERVLAGGAGPAGRSGGAGSIRPRFARPPARPSHRRPRSVRPPTAARSGVHVAEGGGKTDTTFVKGVVVGAAAALVGAVVGGWIAGRRR